MIAFYSLALQCACLALFWHYTLQEKGIFRRWYLFLVWLRWKSCFGRQVIIHKGIGCPYWEKNGFYTIIIKSPLSRVVHSWVVYITKPLGLCLYCSGIWISILIYTTKNNVSFFSLNSCIDLCLFCGISFVFTKVLHKWID